MFAFSTKPPLHNFPSPKRQEAYIMRLKRQIPKQIERISQINETQVVTREVVEAARENLSTGEA
jgi:hypothetical protein